MVWEHLVTESCFGFFLYNLGSVLLGQLTANRQLFVTTGRISSKLLFDVGHLCRDSVSLLLCIHYLKGDRRYFSRHEIAALVGGPGNMAVYRHVLVISSTTKQSRYRRRAKNRLPPNITAVLHYRRKNDDIFWFYRFRHPPPPTLDTDKKHR